MPLSAISSIGRTVTRVVGAQSEPPEPLLNIINLGEVLYTTGRRRGEREAWEMVADVRASAIEIVPADESLVLAAVSLTMRRPIAYADAFAVATAAARGARLVTGDPELRGLGDVPTLWIGDGPAPR